MKRFAILREVDPNLTWGDVDSSALQNIFNMQLGLEPADAFEPRILGVRWVRSYWAPGTDWALCLYTGQSDEQVERWHDWCEVPYVEIREIDEHTASDIPYSTGWHGTPDESGLIAAEGPCDMDLDGALAGAATLVRSYIDNERGTTTALISAAEGRADVIANLSATGWVTYRVVELKPSDYGIELDSGVEVPANA
jgi:hypothetical protein